MRFFAGLLLCACVLTASATVFATGTVDLPQGISDAARSEAHLTVSKTSLDMTSIALHSPAVTMHDQMVDYQSFQSFEIAGESSILEEGSPTVPQVARFYRIPNTGGVDLVLTDAEYDVVDNVNPFPVQPERPGFGLTRNSVVYSKDDWYPANVAVMSDPMIMRDFRLVSVTLYPVQVNPVTHQARIYRSLSVDIEANSQPGYNELVNPRRPSGAWASIYRSQIANLDDNALDDMTTTPGTYMILTSTNSGVRPWVDTLAEWKTRKGFKVIVDARASWQPTDAYNAIHNAYLNADPPLEFALLVGDPGWSAVAIPIGPNNEYDHYYASLTTGDEIEDIGVGRLSCGNAGAIAQAVTKIMLYERDPHMQNAQQQPDTMWFHKAYLLAGIGNQCAGNYLVMRWAKDQFLHNTGVDSISIGTHDTGNGVADAQARSAVNGGVSFMLWRGSWQFQMSTTVADNGTPGGRYPICMCVTCNAGDFTGSANADGPAEDWLSPNGSTVANPKGGVAGMGTTTAGTENGANVILACGLAYNMTDLLVEHLGTAVAGAKAQLYMSYGPNHPDPEGDGNIAYKFTRLFNLFGDPGLSMWTDVPKVLNVTHPTTLDIGARSVSVTVTRAADAVPVADALVVLWKKGSDSTWVKGTTDSQGQLTLPVSVNTAGNLLLTITKRGHKPYLFTIPCGQADVMPMVSSCILDDDNAGGTQGNGDHIMNPGETIDLPIYIKNFGNVGAATGVSATLTSSNPDVTVMSGTSSFADIAAGDSSVAANPYRIHVSAGLQNLTQVLLTLTINSSAGQTVGALPVVCRAGEARYVRQRMNPAFNPGATTSLTVVVKNYGTVPMTGVTGHLVPLSPFVQADAPDATFGDIAPNALDSNSTAFTISANSMTYRGHLAPMRLILSTSSGFSDTTQFTISVGSALSTDATGPDAYGYYAYDNTDVSYEQCPTYSYVDISSSGTNLNLNDPGDKTTPSPIYSTARHLPFSFKFYGRVYDTLTVCSNGWCAFGDQSYLDMFRNYPIPAMGAPDAMIAPYWDDLATTSPHGVWMYNDATNHRFIIQWKAGASSSYATPLDFEVMLYDTTFAPTRDGNGKILMQYNVAPGTNLPNQYNDEAEGCTIGIQAPGNTVGLGYAHRTDVIPGAATIGNGRAILFTTEARMLFGAISGQVTDVANSQPMANVLVGIDGNSIHAMTDATGHYLLSNVLVGNYTVRASTHRYNDATSANVVVVLNDTTAVNLSLTHPLMDLSATSLSDSVRDAPGQVSFSISNPGNGPLDFGTHVYFAGDDNSTPWDSVAAVNVTQLSGDDQVWGCEFLNDEWWVSGASGPSGTPVLYRFDQSGQLLGSVPQPSSSLTGWLDMATDGHYLYGSDSHVIYGIDPSGQVHDTIPSPLNPSRAIAYDSASDHFWVADYTSELYLLDRLGNQLASVANPGLNITGLAWNAADADTGKLYIFSRDGASGLRVSKYNPVTGSFRTVTDLPAHTGDRAAGCTITHDWNSTLLVFGAIIRNNNGARLAIQEMSFTSSWMQVVPSSGTVPGGNSQGITITFDPAILHNATYHVNLHVFSVVYDSTVIMPVTLTVAHVLTASRAPREIPEVFALHQNYPNPFNPSTQIAFDLPRAERVRLDIYNSLGQRVTTLMDEMRPAGSHTITWDGRTAGGADVSSGVYFCRMKAGSFISAKKMLLMR